MQSFTWRDPQLFGIFTAAGIALGGAAAYVLLRRTVSPEELERKRRDMLVQQGRIIDGTVIDISELGPEESGRSYGLRLILYQYEIAGVVYECSQDVTLLAHLFNIQDCRPGFPVSVRYAPRNPGNSLVVAETWSGLRKTLQSAAFPSPPTASKTMPAQWANRQIDGSADHAEDDGDFAKQHVNGGQSV